MQIGPCDRKLFIRSFSFILNTLLNGQGNNLFILQEKGDMSFAGLTCCIVGDSDSYIRYKTLIYSGIVVRAYGDPVFGSNGTPATGGVYFDGEGTRTAVFPALPLQRSLLPNREIKHSMQNGRRTRLPSFPVTTPTILQSNIRLTTAAPENRLTLMSPLLS